MAHQSFAASSGQADLKCPGNPQLMHLLSLILLSRSAGNKSGVSHGLVLHEFSEVGLSSLWIRTEKVTTFTR